MSEKPKLDPELQAKIDKCKADGHTVAMLNIAGTKYIYRSINREEFRNLQDKMAVEAEKVSVQAEAAKVNLKEGSPQMAALNADLQKEALKIRDRGEERLVEQGLIHPQLTANTPAGVSTTIADRIMELSGFSVDAEPELL